MPDCGSEFRSAVGGYKFATLKLWYYFLMKVIPSAYGIIFRKRLYLLL